MLDLEAELALEIGNLERAESEVVDEPDKQKLELDFVTDKTADDHSLHSADVISGDSKVEVLDKQVLADDIQSGASTDVLVALADTVVVAEVAADKFVELAAGKLVLVDDIPPGESTEGLVLVHMIALVIANMIALVIVHRIVMYVLMAVLFYKLEQ